MYIIPFIYSRTRQLKIRGDHENFLSYGSF